MAREPPSKSRVLGRVKLNGSMRKILSGLVVMTILFFCCCMAMVGIRGSVVEKHIRKGSGVQEAKIQGQQLDGLHERFQTLGQRVIARKRTVAVIIFTTQCLEEDNMRAAVLGESASRVGVKSPMVRIVYDCDDIQRATTVKGVRIFDAGRVEKLSDDAGFRGEGYVYPRAAQYWLRHDSFAQTLSGDDFIAILDTDAIFVRDFNLLELIQEAGVRRAYGQTPAWFQLNRPILPKAELKEICPEQTKCGSILSWYEYAVSAPYIVEKAALEEIMPAFASVYEKLPPQYRRVAYPLAIANEEIPHGRSGSLLLSEYNSPMQNWNFLIDVSADPCMKNATLPISSHETLPNLISPRSVTLDAWKDYKDWRFYSEFVPKHFMKCNGDLFARPRENMWYDATHTRGNERISTILRSRHTWMICQAIDAYNYAAKKEKAQCPLNEDVHLNEVVRMDNHKMGLTRFGWDDDQAAE